MSRFDEDTIMSRLTRVETRLARFMVAMGVDPAGTKPGMKPPPIRLRSDYRLDITSLDVSILDVRQFLTAKNLEPGEYDVMHSGVVVAKITLP